MWQGFTVVTLQMTEGELSGAYIFSFIKTNNMGCKMVWTSYKENVEYFDYT